MRVHNRRRMHGSPPLTVVEKLCYYRKVCMPYRVWHATDRFRCNYKESDMGKPALFLVSALLLWALHHAAAQDQAPAAAAKPQATAPASDVANRVSGYTAWDDEYFYVAVQVNKPTVSAKNSA